MINTELTSQLALETVAPNDASALDVPRLKVADRCDCRKCPAQAIYRVQFPSGGILDFCGHHHAKLLIPILEQGGMVVDSNPIFLGAPGVGI